MERFHLLPTALILPFFDSVQWNKVELRKMTSSFYEIFAIDDLSLKQSDADITL